MLAVIRRCFSLLFNEHCSRRQRVTSRRDVLGRAFRASGSARSSCGRRSRRPRAGRRSCRACTRPLRPTGCTRRTSARSRRYRSPVRTRARAERRSRGRRSRRRSARTTARRARRGTRLPPTPGAPSSRRPASRSWLIASTCARVASPHDRARGHAGMRAVPRSTPGMPRPGLADSRRRHAKGAVA